MDKGNFRHRLSTGHNFLFIPESYHHPTQTSKDPDLSTTVNMPTKHECRPQKRARLGDQRIEEENSPPEEELQDVFRKYFEAQFKPLQIKKKVLQRKVEVDQATAEDEGSEWSGFSESEGRSSTGLGIVYGWLK